MGRGQKNWEILHAVVAAAKHLGKRIISQSRMAFALVVMFSSAHGQESYHVKTNHPRLLIEDVQAMAGRCQGPLRDDYQIVKQRADAAVRGGGIEFISNAWSIPEDLMNCGLAYLVEREHGNDGCKYADVIIKQWGDGSIISNPKGSHFGYHALAYDWIYDALTPEQRVRYGDALGWWLCFFTDKPEILLKYGHWEYNQTWGPIHLNRNRRSGKRSVHTFSSCVRDRRRTSP